MKRNIHWRRLQTIQHTEEEQEIIAYYYIDGNPPGTGNCLILRNGMYINLNDQNNISEGSKKKQFLPMFPKSQASDSPSIQKWYREITTYSKTHWVYVHPYFLFRKKTLHIRGLTVGNSPNDDLAEQMKQKLEDWGTLLFEALRSKKVIPDTCRVQKEIVNNYETGQGS